METHISITHLKVSSIDNSSGIFSGENDHQNWSAMNKINRGFGNISGKSTKINDSINLVDDTDQHDTVQRKVFRSN